MNGRRGKLWGIVAIGVVGSCGVSAWSVAHSPREAGAQEIDPRRPRTLAVGAPSGANVGARADSSRSGRSDDSLPHGALRLAWPRRSLNVTVEHAPLVRADGSIVVVTSRGDVHFIDGRDGDELGKVPAAEPPASSPVLLSSGRIAYLGTSGRTIVLAEDRVVASQIVARDRPAHVAPLATRDGGFIVATATELIACDSEGRPRHRAKVPLAPTGALLSNGHEVLLVVADGTVLSWVPGDLEASRVASFESPIDGNAVLSKGVLYAVARGSQLVALDLAHGGASSIRAAAAVGLFLGPPAVRTSGSLSLLQYTATNSIAVSFEPDGTDGPRTNVGTRTAVPMPDGGTATLVAPPHTGVIVDDDKAMAFMTPEGQIGVVTPGGVDTLGENACGTSVGRRAIGQLAPAGKGAFVIACETGTIVKVTTK